MKRVDERFSESGIKIFFPTNRALQVRVHGVEEIIKNSLDHDLKFD